MLENIVALKDYEVSVKYETIRQTYEAVVEVEAFDKNSAGFIAIGLVCANEKGKFVKIEVATVKEA